MKTQRAAFTLVELIIVIAIIAILAGAIFVAIDPARRLHEARNARRMTDIVNILEAIRRNQADNFGVLYSEIEPLSTGMTFQIGTAAEGCDSQCGMENTDQVCVDLSGIGLDYLAVIPKDPLTGTSEKTRYAFQKVGEGAITVYACDAEGEGAGGEDPPPLLNITR